MDKEIKVKLSLNKSLLKKFTRFFGNDKCEFEDDNITCNKERTSSSYYCEEHLTFLYKSLKSKSSITKEIINKPAIFRESTNQYEGPSFPIFIYHNKGCEWILKGGSRKGEQCGKPIKENNLCSTHYNSTDTSNGCNYIIKAGIRRSEKCGKNIKEDGLCYRHFYINKRRQENLTPIDISSGEEDNNSTIKELTGGDVFFSRQVYEDLSDERSSDEEQ